MNICTASNRASSIRARGIVKLLVVDNRCCDIRHSYGLEHHQHKHANKILDARPTNLLKLFLMRYLSNTEFLNLMPECLEQVM